MSRDFDEIVKRINQSHKELYKQDSEISKDISDLNKNQDKILKDIADIRKQVKDIDNKIDLILEILNNFTLMIEEEDETDEINDYLNDYDTDQTWVPDEDDFWKNETNEEDDE